MSNNLAIKLNLTKIPGAALVDLKGNNSTKKCIIIPVEDSGLFVGEKGVYLNLTGIGYREPKYDDTHFIKQSIDKEAFTAMSEAERNALPILGGIRPIVVQTTPMQSSGEMTIEPGAGDGSDLPF